MLVESLDRVAVLRPQVQLLHEDAYRQPEDDNQRQAARHGLQRTAHQQAPLAAAQVLHHEQGQAAHGEAPADDETEQVGAQQVVDSVVIDDSRQHCQHQRQNGKDAADHHSPASPCIDQQRSIQLRG